MKNFLIIVLFLFFYSCAISPIVITDKKKSLNKDWLVHASKNYRDKDNVKITITNALIEGLTIFDPFQKYIEKYDGDTWNKIPVLYCICGNCAPPPELLTLASKENFIFSWDKNVGKCTSGKVQKRKSLSGRYRIIIKYAKTPLARSLEKLIVEFQL